MKKLIYSFILVLALCSNSFSQGIPFPGGGIVKAVPSGGETYTFKWTGDYPDHTDYCWYNSGAGYIDGSVYGAPTIHTNYGQTEYGVLVDSADESILWTFTTEGLGSLSVGTIWASVYVTGDLASAATVAEIYYGGDDKLDLYIRNDEKPSIWHEGNNTPLAYYNQAVSTGTWVRIAGSWSVALQKLAVNTGGNWYTSDKALGTPTGAATLVAVGERYSTHGGGAIWIDNVYITSGYCDADPMQ